MYIPPENSPHSDICTFDVIEQDVLELKSTYDCNLCIFGDANARTGDLDDFILIDRYQVKETNPVHEEIMHECCLSENELNNLNINLKRTSQDGKHNKYGRRLLDLCKVLNLLIVNGRAGEDSRIGKLTCKNASVVDYFICSPQLFPAIHQFKVDTFDPTLSDAHNPLVLGLLANPHTNNTSMDVSPQESKANWYKLSPKPHWDNAKEKDFVQNIDAAKTDKLYEKLELAENSKIITESLINEVVCGIENCFSDSARQCGMLKNSNHNKKTSQPSRTHKPWFNEECKRSRKDFMKCKRTYKKEPSNENLAVLKQQGKEYKMVTKHAYRAYHESLTHKLRVLKTSKPKEYWNILNCASKGQKESLNPPAEDLLKHFRDMNKTSNPTSESPILSKGPIDLHPSNDILNRPIDTEEIKKAIHNLTNNKSSGLDGVLNEYIKATETSLMPLYLKLFNSVLDTGIIPENWSVGKIIPIYKNKGDPLDPNSYRGITILSCLGKLFTSILSTRINDYTNDANILGLEQAGFRKNHSTIDHIFMLNSLIEIYLQKRKRLYCAFIDYEKAFDKVERSLLWIKLLDSKINGKVLNVIVNLYKQAKSCVASAGHRSTFFNCDIGVRQGENLSPILFALFLNDLSRFLSPALKGLNITNDLLNKLTHMPDCEHLMKLFILLYADDTTLLADNPETLQKGLDTMLDYCTQWKIKVNTSKTKIVIFSRGKIRKKPVFTYSNTRIEITDDFVFLGNMFNYNGTFSKAKKRVCDQANKAMFAIIGKSKKLNLPLDIQLHLFDSIVKPILLYGCEVWGFDHTKDIERIHLKFCKIILGLSQYTTSAMVYGELGRVPLSITIKSRMVAYWHRLLTSPMRKLSSLMYNLLYHVTTAGLGESKWLNFVKTVLDECGLSYIWQNQQTLTKNVSTQWIKAKVKLALTDQYTQKWHEIIDTNQNCQLYKCIKPNKEMEQYLVKLPYKARNIISKFRCRNFKLPANPTVYFNEKVKNDHCPICDQNSTGNEILYILHCPALLNDRHLLNIKESNKSDKQKLEEILTLPSDLPHLLNLSKFLSKLYRQLK